MMMFIKNGSNCLSLHPADFIRYRTLAILACLMWPVLPAIQGTHTDIEKIQNGTSIENSEQDRKTAFKFKHIKKHIQHCIELKYCIRHVYEIAEKNSTVTL